MLIQTVVHGVIESANEQYEDDDLQHYIYEAALTAVYGKAYWEWRRTQKW